MNRHPLYYFFVYSALIIFVLVAGFLIEQLIAQKYRKVMVLVAKHDFPKGTSITDPEEMFETRVISLSDAPPDAVFANEELSGRALTRDIKEGERLLDIDLERPKATGSLGKPAPGRQFIPVLGKTPIDSIQPGSRVDVLEGKRIDVPNPEPKILLRNVLVRAVRPVPKTLEEMLDEKGITHAGWSAFILDITDEEVKALIPSKGIGVEIRATGDIEKADQQAKPSP